MLASRAMRRGAFLNPACRLLGALLLGLALLVPAQLPAQAQSRQDALAAFEAGRFQEAAEIWTLLAEGGDVQAQYAIGKLYESGQGVSQSYREAVAWYERAASAGLAAAQNNLALLYNTGRGVARDPVKAVNLWQAAAQQGHVQAQYNLGLAYYLGEGVALSDAEAAYWFARAAESGLPEAQFAIGQMHRMGVGMPADAATALAWYDRAAVQGHAEAARKVAELTSAGVVAAPLTPVATTRETAGPADTADATTAAGQNQTGQNQTGQNQTGQNQTGQNQTGQNQTGQNQTGQNQTGQDQAGQTQSAEPAVAEAEPTPADLPLPVPQTGAGGELVTSGDQSPPPPPLLSVPNEVGTMASVAGDPGLTENLQEVPPEPAPQPEPQPEPVGAASSPPQVAETPAAMESLPSAAEAVPPPPKPERPVELAALLAQEQTATQMATAPLPEDQPPSPTVGAAGAAGGPAAQPQIAGLSVVPDGKALVWLGTGASEQEARELIATAQGRFPDIFGALTPLVVLSESGGRARYRVEAGPLADLDAAQALCSTLRDLEPYFFCLAMPRG